LRPKREKLSNFPCLVYCHGNSGSRLDGLHLIKRVIKEGMGLFLFDFSGSGLSQGEYVTLGLNEKDDLETVI